MMLNNNITAFSFGFGVVAISWIAYRSWRKKQKKRLPSCPFGALLSSQSPSEWHLIGTLKEIIIFPIKSCAPLEFSEAICNEFGVSAHKIKDRSLLVVDDTNNGTVAFAGVHPKMLSIKPQILSENILRLTAPHMKPIDVNFNELHKIGKVTEMHKGNYHLRVIECLPEHHVWFSRVILERENGMRLFVKIETIPEGSWGKQTTPVWFPVMILHDKSVQDLNSRIPEPNNNVNHRQFRGNLVIESDQQIVPFDEDNWLWMKIGDNDENKKPTILRFNSPCMRCILPNIDVDNCLRNKDFEPLKTLKKFRLRSHPKEPEMGVYFDVHEAGILKVGDPIYVQYKKM